MRAKTVVFDEELSPAQGRNLQDAFDGAQIIDRTMLILDIFSQRARTAEGQLQVEMAQLEYQLPRLSRMWTHLERQAGGGGAGGQAGVGGADGGRRGGGAGGERAECSSTWWFEVAGAAS